MQDQMRLQFDGSTRKPDIWAGYDPEQVRQALRESAGALKGVDHDAHKADIQNQRRQESDGRPA
jgi:hypothetical protein